MTHPGWRSDIQGLRAIAVGLVIACHAGISHFGGGYIGVDVFFVLSGFLITGLLLRESDTTGRVSISGFYARRARRILPAATTVLVAVLAYAAATMPANQLGNVISDAKWASIFCANIHFASIGADYFNPTAPSPLQHFWSLAVEEQFYVVWPLVVLLLAHRLSRRAFRGVIVAAALGSLAYAIHDTRVHEVSAYFSTPARAYELLIGAFLAATPIALRRGRLALSLLGIAMLAYATIEFGGTSAFPSWRGLVPTLGTAALLAAGGEGGIQRLLSARPMIWLGDISFSLYLWHYPILLLWPGQPRVLAVLETVAAAAFSYYVIEQPFRTGTFWRPKLASLTIWPVALGLVFATGVGAHAYAEHLQAQRVDAARAWFDQHHYAVSGTSAQMLQQAVGFARQGAPIPPGITEHTAIEDTWRHAYRCYSQFGTRTNPTNVPCAYGDTSSSRILVVTGDSQMGMWEAAFDDWGTKQGVRIVPFVKTGCSMYEVTQTTPRGPDSDCFAFRTWARAQIAALHPDAIVVTARGRLAVQPRGTLSKDETWRQGVVEGLRDLTAVTPHVIVVGSMPARPGQPADCITAPNATQATCMISPDSVEVSSNPITEQAAVSLGLPYVDPVPLACTPAGECPLIVGDMVVWNDDAHLTPTWVHAIGGDFIARLGKPLTDWTTSGR